MGLTGSLSLRTVLGDSNNNKVEGVWVFQEQLYLSMNNLVTGVELWRSPDGTHWTQINPDGFGDSSNGFTLWSSGLANYKGRLFVASSADWSISGFGKIWQLQSQTYLPLVLRQ